MKRSILILSFVMLFANNTQADEMSLPSCGENCTYSMLENGTDSNGNTTYTLIIEPITEGTEATIKRYDRPGYSTTTDYAPWRNANVSKVEVKEGIVSVGGHAFEDMLSIKEVSLPNGLMSIGSEAFHNCRSLEKINLPDTLTSLGEWSLNLTAVSSIEIPSGITAIRAYTFDGTNIETLIIPDNVKSLNLTSFFGSNGGYQGMTLKNLYCPEALKAQCEAAVALKVNTEEPVQVKTYQKFGENEFLIDGRFYRKPNDFYADEHIKKRIYSVGEANAVSGKKNKVMIRYR